ncbi:MAG: uridine kinase [Terricaulis sp.]
MTKIVAIAGGSGSGKTTVARALAHQYGPAAVIVAEDDYYHCSSQAPDFDAATFNFDTPDAKDHSLLSQHLALVRRGQAFDKPLYDLVTHRRRLESETVTPPALLIVEGIHVFATQSLQALYDLKVYVEADEALRLGRRTVRDIEERGRTPQAVLDQYFRTVRPMHEKYIAPQRALADLVLRCEYGAGPEQAAANAARIEAALKA